MQYPESKRETVKDTYFGTIVKDPYRWLEDDKSSKTKDWVTHQNKTTQQYLSQIPYRDSLKNRLTSIWNYQRIGTPFIRGKYEYFYKNDGLQNQSILYRKKGDSKETVFLNPNLFSNDGTTSLGQVSFSKDATLVAYSISEGGSDWRKIILMDVASKKIKKDTLKDVKFSSISWKGNEGFYYSSYDKPKGSELSSKTDQHKLFYHKMGTSQKEDTLIFGKDLKRRYVSGKVTQDDRFLIISASISTSGNELYFLDLQTKDASIIPIVSNFDSDSYIIDNIDHTLFMVTNHKAPNKRLVSFSTKNPSTDHWIDVIPEAKFVLSLSKGSGYFFANYMTNAISKIKQYNYKGELIRDLVLPGEGTVTGLSGNKEDTLLYYAFTNYVNPNTSYSFDPKTGSADLYIAPEIKFDHTKYQTSQIFYPSKDGTKISMIITYKKGTELNGKNPTILYGYGGFNISLTPTFNTANSVWLELGGIYAVANLRGGGEYGKNWHKAGTKLQKQNVFDDFIAAGEYLIAEIYTSSNFLAIRGGSNGGLLVGAVMTQRPELAKVALPAVGVLDMLRYHTFTSGAGWAYDYGTSVESKEMFEYLKKYSPVHNVKQGIVYPATLITTGDHDDRVVPAHSFKFAAELQFKQDGENPVLIRIETDAGHGAGTPIAKTIDQYADIFGFALFNMGIKTLEFK